MRSTRNRLLAHILLIYIAVLPVAHANEVYTSSDAETNLSKGPHKSTIDTHQLLMVDHVGLVQDDSNLVLIAYNRFPLTAILLSLRKSLAKKKEK